MKPTYEIDYSWVGPHDEFPSCKFCRHVGCIHMERELKPFAPCRVCGWNPEVSKKRIIKKYGADAWKFLSESKGRRK